MHQSRLAFGRASYRMAPHCGRTLEELRDATMPRLSDHAPITVVLPVGDPVGTENLCEPLGYGASAAAQEPGEDPWVDSFGL